MKWIGQHIYDLVSRFRSDVYLEDISSGTIASGGNLGLDSNNKIVKASEASGGISFDGSTANGVLTYKDSDEASVESTLTYDAEILTIGDDDNGTATITRLAHSDELGGHFEIKAGNAGGTDKVGGTLSLYSGAGTGTAYGGDIRFYAGNRGVGTGSSNNLPTLMAAIDGSAGDFVMSGIDTIIGKTDSDFTIASDGKLTFKIDADDDETSQEFIWKNYNTEVMNLDESGNLQIDGGLTTGSTSFVNSSGVIQVASQTNITGLGTIGTGTWQGTAIASAYMASATDSAKGTVELATTGEADAGTDTVRAVTPAGLKSHVDARYSYQYISFTSNATTPADGDWMVPSGNGISNHLWNVNASNGSGGSSNGKTKDSSNITVAANYAGNGIVVPQACVLVGFEAFVRNSSRHANLGADGDATEYLKDQRSCGLFIGQPDFNDYAATGDLTLRCYGAQLGQGTTGGGGDPDTDFYLRITKATDMGNSISLSAGDMIVPAMAGTKSDGTHHSGGCIASWTVVLKTLIP